MEEEHGRLLLLVGQDGGEADVAVVVNGDVQGHVTDAGRLARVIAVDAVAGLDDAGQPLDIKVDQVAGTMVFVAHHRRRRARPVHARSA